MSVLQAISARFTSGKTPKATWPANTTPGSFLLAVIHFSNTSSSTVTTGLTSENPLNASWGTPQIFTAGGASGGTLYIYTLLDAAQRVAHDPASGASYAEVITLNTGTFTNVFLVEMSDIEGLDGAFSALNSGTGTTIATPSVTFAQYGSILLGIHCHRNTDDQTPTAPAILLPNISGAGPVIPVGAGANPGAVSTALTFQQPGPVGAYSSATTIGTSRNFMAVAIPLKSFSGARPPFGVLFGGGVSLASAAPALTGGNQQALVGVHRHWSFPPSVIGPLRVVPEITITGSSNIAQTTADLDYTVNPGGLATTLLVEYTTTIGSDGFPSWTSQVTPPPLAVGSAPVDVVTTLTSLSVETRYYWRVSATNAIGTTTTDAQTFITLAIPTAAPSVTTSAASSISDTGATLVGVLNPHNLESSYYFEYGTASDLATFTATTTQTLSSIDDSDHAVSAVITGLTASTTYYYRLHAYNAEAPETTGGVDASIVSFATDAPPAAAPAVTTSTPTTDKATEMVVAGTVDANGASTSWKAQVSSNNFSTVAAETSSTTLTDATAGNVQSVSGTVTGLTAATTYKARIVATNTVGATTGAATSGVATEALPTTSSPSSSHASTTATLSMNVGHTAMTDDVDWSFEYGKTTSYGSAGASGTVAHGDADPTTVTSDLTGLDASTLYHWRGTVARADGDGPSPITTGDQTFTTAAASTAIAVTTPAAHGPSSAITTTSSVAAPAYTIQVKADGTLIRSDTSAAITIAGTEFTGSANIVIASDTAGTIRTPANGVLDQLRFLGPGLIFREINGTVAMGEFEVSNCVGTRAIQFQGCTGIFKHFRSVAAANDGIYITSSAGTPYSGTPSGGWQTWIGPSAAPSPGLTLENFTSQMKTGSTGAALNIVRARNVKIAGFDSGSQSTYDVGPTAADLPVHAVRFDAALLATPTPALTDIQDVYITTAADSTPSYLQAKAGKYAVRMGLAKRSGILAALTPNTLHQRPEKPVWFELANGTQPGSETAANCTNDRVITEHFVNQNWFATQLVTATFRDGATRDQLFEIRSAVFDPATALTLWTPDDPLDNWPNGAKRFITVNGVKRSLGPRPTVPASMPYTPPAPPPPLVNKSILNATWTHMGGASGDGVTEIRNVLIDPDQMVDGTSGKERFKTNITNGVQLIVAPDAAQAGGVPVTLDATTGRTLVVKLPNGSSPDFTKWDATYGIYTNYVDGNLVVGSVAPGVGYQRSLSFTGVDAAAGAFLGVKLVLGPSGTGPRINAKSSDTGPISRPLLRIVSGVAESFWPHGLPPGESVTIATPVLSGTFTVTRVDDYHFLINGQTAISWDATPGTTGTYSPQTQHSYGLTGAQTSITIPAGTTLDSTKNANLGQPVSNTSIHIAAGAHLRFIGCTINDIEWLMDSTASFVELVDCDGSATAMPGGFDYDTVSNLGVAGKYDRFSQHLPGRTLVGNNAFGGQDALWYSTRLVYTGAHGDVFPGSVAPGTWHDECYIDAGSPAGTNNENEAQTRPGIGTSLPKVAHSTHGDVVQWYRRSSPLFTKSYLGTQGHAIYFGPISSNWEQHLNCTLSRDASGAYLVTLAGAEKHNFDSTGLDTAVIKNAGALNGEYTVTPSGGAKHAFVLNGTTYPVAGNPATCDYVHSNHQIIPGFLRSVMHCHKHVNTTDRTRLCPMIDPGNLALQVGAAGAPPGMVVPGEVDYFVKVQDSCIDNGGAYSVPNPRGHPEYIDEGTPNRNAFTVYKGTSVPGDLAVLDQT